MDEPVINAAAWGGAGIGARNAPAWIAAGIPDPMVAASWVGRGFAAEESGAWVAAREPSSVAGHWRKLGIMHPDDRPAGFTDPHHWIFVEGNDLPRDPAWGALEGRTSDEIAQLGAQSGQSAEAVRIASAVLFAPYCPRTPRPKVPGSDDEDLLDFYGMHLMGVDKVLADLRTVTDLDWIDVAACVAAGMTVTQAREHITSGADIGPERLLLALAR